MIDFLTEIIINGDDFETLLGDLYAPTCSALICGLSFIAFGGCVSAFCSLIRGIFGGVE